MWTKDCSINNRTCRCWSILGSVYRGQSPVHCRNTSPSSSSEFGFTAPISSLCDKSDPTAASIFTKWVDPAAPAPKFVEKCWSEREWNSAPADAKAAVFVGWFFPSFLHGWFRMGVVVRTSSGSEAVEIEAYPYASRFAGCVRTVCTVMSGGGLELETFAGGGIAKAFSTSLTT